MVTGLTYWLQVWAIEKKGPVFTALYTPLALILTCIVSSFLFKETLYLGRFVFLYVNIHIYIYIYILLKYVNIISDLHVFGT